MAPNEKRGATTEWGEKQERDGRPVKWYVMQSAVPRIVKELGDLHLLLRVVNEPERSLI
jgi:predicted transcriptional regulator